MMSCRSVRLACSAIVWTLAGCTSASEPAAGPLRYDLPRRFAGPLALEVAFYTSDGDCPYFPFVYLCTSERHVYAINRCAATLDLSTAIDTIVDEGMAIAVTGTLAVASCTVDEVASSLPSGLLSMSGAATLRGIAAWDTVGYRLPHWNIALSVDSALPGAGLFGTCSNQVWRLVGETRIDPSSQVTLSLASILDAQGTGATVGCAAVVFRVGLSRDAPQVWSAAP